MFIIRVYNELYLNQYYSSSPAVTGDIYRNYIDNQLGRNGTSAAVSLLEWISEK